MKIWRMVRAGREAEAFKGIGSERAPGRWHTPPRRVVYAASTAELAILEKLVWVRRLERLSGFTLVPARMPDRCIAAADAPPGWNAVPHRASSRAVGDAWLDGGSTAGLAVPSAISPGTNILLDPSHPDIEHLDIDAAVPVPEALTTGRARP